MQIKIKIKRKLHLSGKGCACGLQWQQWLLHLRDVNAACWRHDHHLFAHHRHGGRSVHGRCCQSISLSLPSYASYIAPTRPELNFHLSSCSLLCIQYSFSNRANNNVLPDSLKQSRQRQNLHSHPRNYRSFNSIAFPSYQYRVTFLLHLCAFSLHSLHLISSAFELLKGTESKLGAQSRPKNIRSVALVQRHHVVVALHLKARQKTVAQQHEGHGHRHHHRVHVEHLDIAHAH